MPEFYWELIQHDGTVIEIPPAGVDVVKRRMANGEPINTKTAIIPANQIKTFRQMGKQFNPQPLLEAAAQAFDEPVVNDDGSVASKWVKKPVTQREYAKHFSNIPAYRKLADENNVVVVAFRLPVHQINYQTLEECTEQEVQQLTHR